MAGEKIWVVTLSDAGRAQDIRPSLREAGFAVDQVLDAIGVITGTGDDQAAARVRRIDGVAAVEAETRVDIGPPDAPFA